MPGASHEDGAVIPLSCSPVLVLTCSIFRPAGEKSGRQDLNLRPLRPERSALAKLSYAPSCGRKTVHTTASRVKPPPNLRNDNAVMHH